MSKSRQLLAALFLAALLPAAASAQSQDGRADAVSYARSFANGVEQFDAGRYEEALESFLAAVVANPRDADALFDVGATYEKLGRQAEASAAYRSALELRPAYAKARARLCKSLVASSQFWEGVGACSRALRADGTDPGLFAAYGRAFEGAGLYDQAAEAYRMAIRLRPRAAEYHLARGRAHERLGEYRDARDSRARAARLAPDSNEARAEFARVTAELSDLERGLEGVGGYERLLNVGHAYRLKGWYANAVAVYALAAARRPGDAVPVYYLGLAYYSMNQYQRALASYKRALALDPKMEEARRDYEWLSAYLSGGARGGGKKAAAAAGGVKAVPASGVKESGSIVLVRPK
ncbi:MAG: tetratricopeptide repeat protein [Pyrinomonadaceae bacterium]